MFNIISYNLVLFKYFDTMIEKYPVLQLFTKGYSGYKYISKITIAT